MIEVKMLEIRCPGCNRAVAHKTGPSAGALTLMGHAKRWYGLIGLLVVKCDDPYCGCVWMPSAAGGAVRATEDEQSAIARGISELSKFTFYRDITCPDCSVDGAPKILGKVSMLPDSGQTPKGAPAAEELGVRVGPNGAFVIPYQHVVFSWAGRIAVARGLAYVECDRCHGTFDAVASPGGRIGLFDIESFQAEAAALAAVAGAE